MPNFQTQSDFGRDLRKQGRALLERQPSGRYSDAGQWLRAATLISLFIASYGLVLSRPPDGWSIGIAAIAGLFAYMLVATLCHDASHNSLHRRRWVNRTILFLGFSIVGVSGQLWAHRHVHTHHKFPNVAGTDIDADSTILVRLTPYRPWYPWHRFQLIYAPLLYLLVLAHLTFVEDIKHFRDARRIAPHRFRTTMATIEFVATKLIHITLAIIAPFAILQPLPAGLFAGYLAASATASAMFVLINIGTHVCDEADFIAPDHDGSIGHDWATHQALTAVDWSPESQLAVAITGGANAHAAHHLFPEAAHCHNARLSRLVSSCARTHGVRHNVVSFKSMLASHLRLLAALSQNDGAAGRRQSNGDRAQPGADQAGTSNRQN